MAADDKYVKVKFQIDAQIGDVYFDDVVSVSATFGLNTIPTATLTVAVGKDHKRDKLATIHTERAKLKPRDPSRVFLTIKPESGNTDKIKTGGLLAAMGGGTRFKIFEGYLAGIGYQRSHNNANYTLNLVHWLDDLNNSSALVGNWFPGSSYDLAQTAIYNALGPDGTAGLGVPTLDPQRTIVTLANVQEDLWLKSIRPMYEKIATWGNARDQLVSPNGRPTSKAPNHAAIGPTSLGPDGALKRMPGTGAKYYKPLSLDLSGIIFPDVADAIRHALQLDLINSFEYNTFWNKLVGQQAPQFFFAISPAVDWALPIPFFAGLDREWVTIYADEYSYANFNASMQQMIESVDVFHPVNASMIDTGGLGASEGATGMRTPFGQFPGNTSDTYHGLKLYKEPPKWLTNVVRYHAHSPGATGIGGPQIGDTAAPNFGATASVGPASPIIKENIRSSGTADRLAEHWYKSEVLYQRYGEMSGHLRFDIAPGSIIKIETPPKDVVRYGAQDKHMFATVTQVSYVINAEKAVAGTSFSLAHIRTEEENDNPLYTAGEAPLFFDFWEGGPLADPL